MMWGVGVEFFYIDILNFDKFLLKFWINILCEILVNNMV